MLLDTLQIALWTTASLVGVGATIYFLVRIAPLIGRPLVRRLFGLAYSDDEAALAQTGEIAVIILGVLIVGIWIFNCARETNASGKLLTEWPADVFVRVVAESIVMAIMVEGMLSAVAMVVPGLGKGKEGDRRPTMVRSAF